MVTYRHLVAPVMRVGASPSIMEAKIDYSVHERPGSPSAIEAYRDHWGKLHREQNPTPDWFADWVATIPGACNCKSDFSKIVAANPPRYGSEWFAYSVEAHNAVNAKLGKPIVTLEEARAIWG